MLTKSGAKLLDFGLAKAGSAILPSGVQPTALPTVTAPLTSQGTILGTFQYMAPEQVEGEEADARSDVFAFGAVLYEMLTGQKAFTGKSQASLLGAILKDQPPLVSSVQPLTPPTLDRIVRTCLAKDRDDRFQSAHDLLLQLQWVAEGGSAAGLPAPIVAHRRHRERFAWIALAAVTLLWLVTLVPAWKGVRAPVQAPPVQFTVMSGAIPSAGPWPPLISPDGRMLMFNSPTSMPGDPAIIWIRPLDAVEPRPLQGTQPGNAFWSADSREIAFTSQGKLNRIDAAGGPVQLICDLPGVFMGGAWNRAGEIVFTVIDGRMFRVPATGGVPAEIARSEEAHTAGYTFNWPSFLPDGRHILVTAWHADPAKRQIQVRTLDDATAVTILNVGSNAFYAPPGYLLYQRDGTLMAQAFDVNRLVTSGEAVRISDVPISRTTGRGAFSVSDNGVLAYRAGASSDPISTLTWYDRQGRVLGTVGDPGPHNQIRLSPDGTRVILALVDLKLSTYVLSVLDLGSGVASRMTPSGESANDAAWSPDSETVAFESRPKGRRDFYSQTVGSRSPTLMFESADDPKWLDDWSADGRYLLFHVPGPGKLFALPTFGDRQPLPLMTATAAIDGAHFSSDGKWVVYQSQESGTFEVWVASFPAFDHRRQISTHGGGQAWWRSDGKEVFYLRPDGKLMSVTVASEAPSGALVFRPPVELFQSPLAPPNLTIDQYTVARDGQRFLFIQPRQDQTVTGVPMTVVVNWPSTLPK